MIHQSLQTLPGDSVREGFVPAVTPLNHDQLDRPGARKVESLSRT